MRESTDGSRRSRQRRRYAAAAACLGLLALDPGGAFGLTGDQARLARPSGGHSRVEHEAVRAPAPARGLERPAEPSVRTAVPGATPTDAASATAAQPSASVSASPTLASPSGTVNPDFGSQNLAYAAMSVSDPLTAVEISGLPQVGAIFGYEDGEITTHFCSGTVLASDAGDLVVTAAHCVYNNSTDTYADDIAFVPGYHDGQKPFGVWTPAKMVVAEQWMDDGDPDYDVAFLVVHQAGSNQRIADAVGGGETLGIDPAYTTLTRVDGYPSDTDKPVTCTNNTRALSSTQVEFDCAGFPDGTSGGPFLADVDPNSGLGTVTGVIGGYQTGGDTPDISYSSYFSDAVAALYAEAEASN